MKLLLLGGTTEGRLMAERLSITLFTVIYSVAGLVRQPRLSCKVISGGFSNRGGLSRYLVQEAFDLVLDATHPYAEKMSCAARRSCRILNLPYIHYLRPPWQAAESDRWLQYSHWSTLLADIPADARVFFSSGQLPDIVREAIDMNKAGQSQLLRTAVLPTHKLMPSLRWLQGIGPFSLDDELALLTKEKITHLVTKNSGGEFTQAKLLAARLLSLPVYMLARPLLKPTEKLFDDVEECLSYLLDEVAKV